MTQREQGEDSGDGVTQERQRRTETDDKRPEEEGILLGFQLRLITSSLKLVGLVSMVMSRKPFDILQ